MTSFCDLVVSDICWFDNDGELELNQKNELKLEICQNVPVHYIKVFALRGKL